MGQVTKRFDVVAGRKYESRGEEKTHWINVGEAAEWDDGGISLKLHAVPTGNWFDGSLKLFERKPKDDQDSRGGGRPARQAERNTSGQQARPAPLTDDDDEIPFISNRDTW